MLKLARLPGTLSSIANTAWRSYSTSVNKSSLSKLRRNTGYAFSLCREALVKNENDYSKALNWLNKEAVNRGWKTAGKLAGRPLSQGLLGVLANRNNVVIVEVNCETDFVARNEKFQSLVAFATEMVMSDIMTNPGKCSWSTDELASLTLNDTRRLADLAASIIGGLGENIALRRAVGLTTRLDAGDTNNPAVRLASYVHMSTAGVTQAVRDVKFGKYAAAIRYRPISDEPTTAAWYERANRLGGQLCQHIVGMCPKPGLLVAQSTSSGDPDEEQCLLLQPFFLDENVLVGDHLRHNDMHLEDFVRVECGRDDDVDEQGQTGSTKKASSE